MTITIRTATIDDAVILANLNRAVHDPHVEQHPEKYKPFIPDNPVLIATYTQRLKDESFFTLIAEDSENPVGYVQCIVREKPENAFRFGLVDCHIDQIAVLETHQGQGIGKQLIQEAMRIGQERGATVITLGVVAFNEKAIKFYETLGFTVESHKMSFNIITDEP